MPLRLVHFSDVHLDQDGPPALKEAHQQAFLDALRVAVAQQAEVILLSGDLFDSNRAPDALITWTMERLAALPTPVVMIPGNHDCLTPEGIYARHDFARLDNVTLLRAEEGEAIVWGEKQLRVWGKGMVHHTPQFAPLGDLPPPQEGCWNLALGHGIYVDEDTASYRSSPIQGAQIADSGYDYLALGHHHARLDVSEAGSTAHYAGSTVPVSRRQRGTVLQIDLQPQRTAKVQVHEI